MKKNNILFIALSISLAILASCGSDYHKNPGKIYMPDMTYSRAYQFYSNNPNYANGITAQAPVAGTVARGAELPDHLSAKDTAAGYAEKCNLEMTMAQVEEGGRLFNIHCAICHGNGLDGNGPLYSSGKFVAAPANFKDPKYLNLSVGQMHYAIMYGKNLMGSYASQLDSKQRWMVLAYIKKFQSENGGAGLASNFNVTDAVAKVASKDSTKKIEVKTEAVKDTTKK